MQGISSSYFVHYMQGILKMYLKVQTRYRNPDNQILGTLKIKMWIYSYSNNMGSNFIFRGAIYFQIENLAQVWKP